jgi:hypothetical protein
MIWRVLLKGGGGGRRWWWWWWHRQWRREGELITNVRLTSTDLIDFFFKFTPSMSLIFCCHFKMSELPMFAIDFCFLDLKLSPCLKCNMFSFGCFPGVWMLITDVSEHSIGSIFKGRSMSASSRRFGTLYRFHLQRQVGEVTSSTCLWRWNRYSVPKRRLLALRRRGNTQK